MVEINAKEVVGVNAISMQSGKHLYNKIAKLLISGKDVNLDFSEVELFASPFFNASIGLLLKDIKIDDLQLHLKIINLSPVGNQLLNHVIENAIKYYGMENQSIDDMKMAIKDNNE